MAKFISKKKIRNYSETECDQVLHRLQDNKQDNSKYAEAVDTRRRELVAKNLNKTCKAV